MGVFQELQCIAGYVGLLDFLCSWANFFKVAVIILYYVNFEWFNERFVFVEILNEERILEININVI